VAVVQSQQREISQITEKKKQEEKEKIDFGKSESSILENKSVIAERPPSKGQDPPKSTKLAFGKGSSVVPPQAKKRQTWEQSADRNSE
jgi:hypothetical protein